MKPEEVALTEENLAVLIRLSEYWEAECSCWGYRANGREDIEGHRIFFVREGETVLGYLFGHFFDSENMKSVMPEGSRCFEIDEISVIPERRSQGIGKALFEYAADAVRDEAAYITLSTAVKNWRAIFHFYLDELGMSFWSARLFLNTGGNEYDHSC